MRAEKPRWKAGLSAFPARRRGRYVGSILFVGLSARAKCADDPPGPTIGLPARRVAGFCYLYLYLTVLLGNLLSSGAVVSGVDVIYLPPGVRLFQVNVFPVSAELRCSLESRFGEQVGCSFLVLSCPRSRARH